MFILTSFFHRKFQSFQFWLLSQTIGIFKSYIETKLDLIPWQDSDERCYSDSLAELPEHNEVNGKKVRALNLDLIKRRLDRGLYKRLDDFQRDIFSVLDRARNLSRTDSQVFEDSVELQTHFIRIRDEACGHGEILQVRFQN